MIKVTNNVMVYEFNGKDQRPGIEHPDIEVCSHWNQSQLVVLVVDGHSYTVNGRDLTAAISNAQNSARF